MSDAIIGSLIGGSIAIVGLIFAKEGKTSEFRQQWIDGLRADVARVIALAIHICLRTTEAPELADLMSANEYLARIKLRLNPTENSSKALLNSLDRLEAGALSKNPQFAPLAEDATSKAQFVLKEEWTRVKRGEWKYQTVLWAAAATLVASSAGIVFHLLHR